MMTTTNNPLKKSFVILSFLIFESLWNCFCADTSSKWMIAAERFNYVSSGGEDAGVAKGISEMFPNLIMSSLNEDLVHLVYPDEKREISLYDLRKTRLSLFLQLSAEYKKRDAIFLNNYSRRKLNAKLRESEKSIKEIQKKIADNLQEVDRVMQRTLREEDEVRKGFFNMDETASEGDNFKSMFRNLFRRDAELVTSEDIAFYKNDQSAFFEPSEKAKKYGYSSYDYEKEAVAAGIDTLITGTVTNYGEYYFVSVDVYEFPGGKLNQSVSEVGSINNADMICAGIAHQLVITLTNGMPVDVEVTVEPAEAAEKVRIYLDDDIQPPKMRSLRTLSGVHSLRFVSEGYREMGTSYFFEGNRSYSVQVKMQEESEIYIDAINLSPFPGRFYAAGAVAEPAQEGDDDAEFFSKAKIRINGTQILGQFISDDGFSTNYYIPENLLEQGNFVSISSKSVDVNDYIDKRRRIMYGSYTLLMISMIPYFYTYGNYFNAANAFNSGLGSYEDALSWQTRNNICAGISIGCGALFVYELVRYLVAANSVLPQKAKFATPEKIEKQRQRELKKNQKMRKTEGTAESEEKSDAIENEEKIEIEEEE